MSPPSARPSCQATHAPPAPSAIMTGPAWAAVAAHTGVPAAAHRRRAIGVPMESPEDLLCPQCAGATPIEHAVFVAHLECRWNNPFWNPVSARVEVPPGALSFLDAKTAQSVTVEHWEIDMLR